MPDYTPDFIAKETMKSIALYNNRQSYKKQTQKIFEDFNNNYIDLWYDVPFYGKVNRNGSLYVPKPEQITYSAKEETNSFNFVSQAFKEFQFYMRRAIHQGRTKLFSIFDNFNSKGGFDDSILRYINYSLSVVNVFNKFIASRDMSIANLNLYTLELLKFVQANDIVFSFYSFFSSSAVNIRSSGLAIELGLNDYNNDEEKNKYFKNNEFYKYIQAAANFGFRVDKNAPWILIADLNSKPMREGHLVKRSGKNIKIDGYMPQHYIPSIDYLFENFYNKAIEESFFLLKAILITGYNLYRKEKKFIIKPGKTTFIPDMNFKFVSLSNIKRDNDLQLLIRKYTQSEIDEIKDCFFLTILEKLLMLEFKTQNNISYRMFKKKFLQHTQNKNELSDSLKLLETFYNPTKIFDPKTKKPFWTQPKKVLTPKNQHIMIPNERVTPTISKIVTEFYTGF